jgi:hypothetical protein
MIDICQLGWLPIFLSWLLPFLLGLLLGRLMWGPFKIRAEDQEKELIKYKTRVQELDADLQNSQKARTQLEGDAAILRGRVRELEAASKGNIIRPGGDAIKEDKEEDSDDNSSD